VKGLIKRSDFYLIPNVLSISRVAAIPAVVGFSYVGMDWWAAGAFALAGISDYVDGWVARRYGYESKLGMLLDPLADKIIVLTTMVMVLFLGRLHFTWAGWDLAWVGPVLVIVTVGRETAITGLRTIASTVGITMPADRWGKLKTWIQFFAILFLLINHPPLLQWGRGLIVASVAAALVSGILYTLRLLKKLPA
jgi:CDP-diacylglycerol--glycerol-3-phosphate 3-phosphatidyltransferase